jgi:hypothetical protein
MSSKLIETNNEKFNRKIWVKNDILHNENGPALEYTSAGEQVQEYFYEGKRHRIDGPAVISKSVVMFYNLDKMHRTVGPAVIYQNYVAPVWVVNDLPYGMFIVDRFLNLQKLVKILVYMIKNRDLYNPKNLGGKFVKTSLMKLLNLREN